MPQIDWNFIITKFFDVLCQGTVAGVIVLIFSEKFRSNRERKTMRQYAVLLSAELTGHSILFSEILKTKIISPSAHQTCLTTFLWKDVRLHFTVMPNHHFNKLALYYQMLPSTIRILEIYSGTFPPPEHAIVLNQSLIMCQISLLITQAYTEPKDSMKAKLIVDALILEKKAQATYPHLFK